jgi:hypothetical protein
LAGVVVGVGAGVDFEDESAGAGVLGVVDGIVLGVVPGVVLGVVDGVVVVGAGNVFGNVLGNVLGIELGLVGAMLGVVAGVVVAGTSDVVSGRVPPNALFPVLSSPIPIFIAVRTTLGSLEEALYFVAQRLIDAFVIASMRPVVC